MTDEQKLAKLEAYINKTYDAENGAATELHSDVFQDGDDYGTCWALFKVATIIGMDVDDPHPQVFD